MRLKGNRKNDPPVGILENESAVFSELASHDDMTAFVQANRLRRFNPDRRFQNIIHPGPGCVHQCTR